MEHKTYKAYGRADKPIWKIPYSYNTKSWERDWNHYYFILRRKIMVKKVLSVILSIVLGLSLCLSVFALEDTTQNGDAVYVPVGAQSVSVVEDPEELQKIIDEHHLNVPEGYTLEKVETFVYTEDYHSDPPLQPMPRALLYEIRNVRRSPNEFYYVNEYDSDWYEGSSDLNAGLTTIKETYTRSSSVKIDIDTMIGKGTVSAGVGYSITDTYTKSKTFETKISPRKKVNVRIHTVYQSTQFDIYNQWTNHLVEKDAWTAQPIGLYFAQYTYSM